MGKAKDDYQRAMGDYETLSGKLERARWEYGQEMDEWLNGEHDGDIEDEQSKENKKLLRECNKYYREQKKLEKELPQLRRDWMKEKVLEVVIKKVKPKPSKALKKKRL